KLSEYFSLAKAQLDVQTVKKRLLYTQALEAARAWQDGIVTDALEGDISSILGIGFPPFTGGVYSFLDDQDLAEFIGECKDFAAKFGAAFKVPEILQTMAKSKETFHRG